VVRGGRAPVAIDKHPLSLNRILVFYVPSNVALYSSKLLGLSQAALDDPRIRRRAIKPGCTQRSREQFVFPWSAMALDQEARSWEY
jgi:hypothetical protein